MQFYQLVLANDEETILVGSGLRKEHRRLASERSSYTGGVRNVLSASAKKKRHISMGARTKAKRKSARKRGWERSFTGSFKIINQVYNKYIPPKGQKTIVASRT